MGVSAGRITVDDGESMGVSVQRAGKASDDDEDLLWNYGDQGGGGGDGLLEEDYQQAIEKIRIIEQARQNLAYQRHPRLHARQEDSSLLSGAMDTVGVVDSVISGVSDILGVASNGPIVSSTSIVPTAADSSTLSIVPPSGLDVSSASVPTNIISDVPIGSTLQTLLSSTPPPSPAETSAGMSIPSVTTTSSSTITTQPQNTGSTNTRPYTTITSYWTSQTSRNNGTTLSNTRTASSTSSIVTASTVTLDGTVIVFTYPTNTADSSFSSTGNSSTRSPTSSVSSSSSFLNSTATSSTISFESLATSLWGSATDVAGGVGGGYVAPTSSSSTVVAPSPTSTDVPSADNSPPVSPGLLGGVLGGVAGLAFMLVAILYLLRRHKREVAAQQRDEAGYGGPLGDADQMTQRSSAAPFAFAGGFFARNSRQSRISQSSEAPTVPSTEVGFYKVSGRKLPPVLGGPRPDYNSTRSAGGSSLYPDDDGITVASTPSVAGPSRYSSMTSASPTGSTAPMTFSTPVSPPISSGHPLHIGSSMAAPPPRIQEEAAEESDTESTHKLPRPPPFPRQLSAVSVGSVGKDGVGRSLPSHDGSRASRFTEDIV